MNEKFQGKVSVNSYFLIANVLDMDFNHERAGM